MNTEYLKKDLLDLYVIVTILVILFIILCYGLAIVIRSIFNNHQVYSADRLSRPEPENQEAIELDTVHGDDNPDGQPRLILIYNH